MAKLHSFAGTQPPRSMSYYESTGTATQLHQKTLQEHKMEELQVRLNSFLYTKATNYNLDTIINSVITSDTLYFNNEYIRRPELTPSCSGTATNLNYNTGIIDYETNKSSWISGYKFEPETGVLRIQVDTASYYDNVIENTPLNSTYGMEYANTTGSLYVTDGNSFLSDYSDNPVFSDPRAVHRQRIRSNLLIRVKHRGTPIHAQESPNELVAIETLREEISESEFRRYIKYGFVLVQGESGLVYQIFRGRDHTIVRRNGKVVEEVCIRLRDPKVPPTDHVIALRAMVMADEEEFKRLGNRYRMAA